MNAAVARKSTSVPASTSGPAIVVRPETPKDIVQILRNPRRFPSPVRPQGSGSTITRCTLASGGTLMDMTGMNRVLNIGADTVTVQPGILVSDLAELLRQEGK